MDFHIESVGEGPAILFVHAGVADSRMWHSQISHFSKTHQVVAYDQRGFGRTPWVPEPYAGWEDAVAVLDRVGVDSATIVGCSMGGAIALELAIDHPHRVNGLVLVGAYPGGWVPEGGFVDNPLEDEAARAAKAGDFDRVVEIDLQMWLVGYGRSADLIDPAHRELFIDMDSTPVRTAAERDEYSRRFHTTLNDHLDEIESQTLVIVGAHDEDLLIEAAHHLADKLSDRPPVVIADSAHLPSLEQPTAFNRALSRFLETP